MEDQSELTTDQLQHRSVVTQRQSLSGGRRSLGKDTTYRVYDYIFKAPTVVLTPDNEWVEMRCPVCEGNATRTHAFFKGIPGLKGHLRTAHGSEGAKLASLEKDAFVEKCKYALVSEELAIEYEDWKSKPSDPTEIPIPAVPWPVESRAARPEQQLTPDSDSARSSSPEIPLAERTTTEDTIFVAPKAKMSASHGIKRTFSERSAAVQFQDHADISQQASQRMSRERAQQPMANDGIQATRHHPRVSVLKLPSRHSGFPFEARV